jgi:hypothetical protein
MAKIIPITEHFQHFLAEMKESFWGDLSGQTQRRGSGFSNCRRSGRATGFSRLLTTEKSLTVLLWDDMPQTAMRLQIREVVESSMQIS